ncbi:MAG: NAD(P)-dependent alcohol dehydrogenase [Ekhidna sp.]|nr:NAD(P)-dependent alcohol dehydrogenase [Ekhidna sp.]
MKAAVYTSYGSPSVLQVTEIEKPIPKANEVLVKIHAATVTAGDIRLRASDFPLIFWLPARIMFGLFKPKKKILGHEFGGVIEAVGDKVSKFTVGDEVFGTTTMLSNGSYAEYVCVPEVWKSGVVAKKPKNLSFVESAALPVGAMTALFLLKKAKINQSKKVLIYGASGSVGSYAVQLAHHLGKSVTGVCSTSNIDMVISLGADEVIDYKKQDYTTSSQDFDIIFDAVGKTSKTVANKVLKKDGVFVSVKMMTSERIEDLLEIKHMAEAGDLKPFIDKTYSLDQIVEAHTYVDSGRKRGNVAITIEE